MSRTAHLAVLLTLPWWALPPAAGAEVITNGFTFSVASDCGSTAMGSHFHSSTGGDSGNPAGKAEVGSYGGASCEEVRGLSEYSLAGSTSSTSAFVTFEVFEDAGLFVGDNDFPCIGSVSVVAHPGNNTEDLFDYEAPVAASVGSLETSSLGPATS